MDLSIIIVNYDTLELTQQCINSVRDNTHGIEYEIIVVDNASTDGSREIMAEQEGILFIESGGNLGFGRANNLGAQQATGRYLLMLNSDTIVVNNILGRMVERFDRQPLEVACLGSLLVHGDRKPSYSFGYFVDWRDEFRIKKEGKNNTVIVNDQEEVDYVSGADLFVRKEVADKIGLFDPDFFMYYEDMELGYRYKKNGYSSVIVNEKGIIHLEGASSNSSYRKVCIITRSYMAYLRKTLNKSDFRKAKIWILLRRCITSWCHGWSFVETLNYIQLMMKS